MEKMLMVTQTVVFLTTSLTVGVNLNLVKELQFFFFKPNFLCKILTAVSHGFVVILFFVLILFLRVLLFRLLLIVFFIRVLLIVPAMESLPLKTADEV